MQQEKNLDFLLKNLNPSTSDDSFVFCAISVLPKNPELEFLDPWGIVKEEEGITLILKKERADAFGLTYESTFGRITLQVYSSLDAVGLSAAVATALAAAGISANIVAGYHHDHIFVPKSQLGTALNLLRGMQCS
ncbi:MAG: ACT domain-containing protein [Spirochaetia bacterium]|jgi:hypothetical protein|nr:ACT domain-containing protein [Spirochaetia bacterium]